MSEIIDVPMSGQRSLATVTAEIRAYQDAARRMAVQYSIEIGRRLIEAKEMVGHGEWGDYLREELGFSQSTANNHMAMFRAYAADQMRLDGDNLKNQAFGNLTYTQALALLALPSEEEREAFVESHDMAGLSTRELREELRRRGEKPEEDAFRMKLITEQADKSNSAWAAAKKSEEAALKAAAEAEDKVQAADRKAQEAADRMSALQAELDKARKAKDKAKREMEKAKANKTVLERLRKEAEAAAEARHKADSEELAAAKAQCVKAEADVDAARREAARAREAAERLEKELKLAAPEMAAFKVRFEAAQEAINKAVDELWNLPSDKVDGGVRAVRALLEQAGKRLEAERYEEAMPE